MHISDGEKRTRDGVGRLDDHFFDQVGRSFSRIREYTDNDEVDATASRPGARV
jgi:hypothetical protein